MEADSIYTSVIIVTIILLVLIGGIMLILFFAQKERKKHLVQLRQTTQEAQEQTMSQLASELHDDVGVTLSSVKLFLSKISSENTELIRHSQELLDESIQKIRGLSHQLHPAILQHLGLETAIRSMLDVISKSGSIETRLVTDRSDIRFPEQTELALFRIVQELLNNLIKHAHPDWIVVKLSLSKKHLLLCIQHNGIGLTKEDFYTELYKKDAIGLKNVYNRLQLLDASIEFEKHADNSFELTISSPVN